jgi:hypothetical protein
VTAGIIVTIFLHCRISDTGLHLARVGPPPRRPGTGPVSTTESERRIYDTVRLVGCCGHCHPPRPGGRRPSWRHGRYSRPVSCRLGRGKAAGHGVMAASVRTGAFELRIRDAEFLDRLLDGALLVGSGWTECIWAARRLPAPRCGGGQSDRLKVLQPAVIERVGDDLKRSHTSSTDNSEH